METWTATSFACSFNWLTVASSFWLAGASAGFRTTPITDSVWRRPGALTTSIGVSASDRMAATSAEELLAAADKVMYESKRRGKNRVTSWPLGLARFIKWSDGNFGGR